MNSSSADQPEVSAEQPGDAKARTVYLLGLLSVISLGITAPIAVIMGENVRRRSDLSEAGRALAQRGRNIGCLGMAAFIIVVSLASGALIQAGVAQGRAAAEERFAAESRMTDAEREEMNRRRAEAEDSRRASTYREGQYTRAELEEMERREKGADTLTEEGAKSPDRAGTN